MTQVTPTELALLRTKEQRTQLFLSIYQPQTIFAARINDVTIQVGVTQITFDTVSAGVYTNIKAGMTLYIGSTPGGSNYGRIRVRLASSTILLVAENSDINWKDNLYLTVKNYYEVWPVYQTLQQSGNTPATDEILVYKDADIYYVNQNDYPGSLIWMGSHQAAWLENGQASIWWSAAGTINTNGDSASYLWNFAGGSSTGTTLQNPGQVIYTVPGHYVTQLDVTSSSGTVDTSYRYVSIYDNAHPPITEWGMGDLRGSRSGGSYLTDLWVRQPVDGIVEGALVVIFSKNYYGTTPYTFLGNIEYVGYILNDSISYNYQDSKVEFSVGSVTEVMKLCEGPGVSLTSVPVPINWSEMSNITIRKAIWWFLKWHSTVMNMTDIGYWGMDYPIYSFETNNGTLYQVLADFMQSTLVGTIAATRLGSIICEVDPAAIHHATTAISLGMSIDRQDWVGSPNIREATRPTVSYLEMGGYAFVEGAITGSNTPYLACSPGVVPSYFGKMEEQQGLALTSQEQLNTLIGDVFSYKNARYPETTLSMAGNYGNIEFIPAERYLLTVDAKDSQGRIVINNLPIHPVELTWKYIPERSYFSVDAVFHELTEGTSGTYLDIPQAPIYNIPPVPLVTGTYIVPPPVPTPTPPPPVPIIPPPPPPILGCMSADNPNGPFIMYPDKTVLSSSIPSTFCWFPCQLREQNTKNNRTFVTVYYGIPYSGVPYGVPIPTVRDYLNTVEAVIERRSGFYTYLSPNLPATFPASSSSHIASSQVSAKFLFAGYRPSWIVGFKINLNLNRYGSADYQDLTYLAYVPSNPTYGYLGAYTSGKLASVEFLGYHIPGYYGDSRGYARFSLPGVMKSGSIFNAPGSGNVYCSVEVGLNGTFTQIVSSPNGNWNNITVNQDFDTVKIKNNYQAANPIVANFSIYGATPLPVVPITITKVTVNNICPT